MVTSRRKASPFRHQVRESPAIGAPPRASASPFLGWPLDLVATVAKRIAALRLWHGRHKRTVWPLSIPERRGAGGEFGPRGSISPPSPYLTPSVLFSARSADAFLSTVTKRIAAFRLWRRRKKRIV